MEDQNNKKGQVKIELSPEIAQGIYSNLAIISHSPSEFVIDFARLMPGVPKASVKSRIVLTPEHAKRLLQALKDNLNRFEEVHGPIKNIAGPNDHGSNFPPMNFGPTGQA
ncbi:DUF3467 domain-containing protein [Marinilabilia rubra]|uniref:DUF3467 domain-containing protein n=1 Tax=Marinilabilia rubra TaxID=2162893 RepID=A0A2U2BCU6_9BACT|nr:DUF3467 domain-containing protein [Marinilabilia rubra]PWE00881.1 DUF3467 domain-containing protein [Marinilabilia rubra]